VNTVLEAAFLTPISQLDELTGTIKFVTGADDDVGLLEDWIVTVTCDDSEHVCGPLWKASIKITYEQPAAPNGDRPGFVDNSEVLRGWVEDSAAVDAVTATGVRIAGHKLTKSLTTFLEGKWVAHFEMTVGVDTTVSP
jgi:hypothetical protein